MARLRIRPSMVALGIAVVGLIATATMAAGLLAPQTDFAAGLGLAPIYERRADALAQTAATSEADRTAAVRETRRSLAQAPANPTSWLRLAYLDSVSPSGLTSSGDSALAASYSVAPYGPDVTDWRLAFAFNHWDVLSQENRLAALDELRVTSSKTRNRSLLAQVSNPAGRIALSLTNDALERDRQESQPAI